MSDNFLIQKMFENRGYDDSFLRDINQSHHDILKDSDKLCETLHQIKMQNLHIVCYPDFDTDGIMSGVVSFAGLSELGFSVSLFLPDPNEGYGFKPESLKRLLHEYPDADVILTSDVGITSGTAIAMAKQCGLMVLVTDHHKQIGSLPVADVVVDPMRVDETYSHPYICGSYVIYQVLEQYACKYGTPFQKSQIRRLRVFAGIGTISDTMLLYYENRQLVKDAILICRLLYSNQTDFVIQHLTGCEIYRRAFYGLWMMLKIYADSGVIDDASDIDEIFFGYYLAPAFNSVKRMGESMSKAFGVFFGGQVEEDANYLYMLNNQRKELVRTSLIELQSVDQPYAPYVYLSSAPSGILGLLAQDIIKQTGVPTIVVNCDDMIHGSGRSPMWYPCLTRMNQAGFSGAGHDPAFGVWFADEAQIVEFCNFVQQDLSSVLATIDESVIESKPDFVIALDNSGDIGIDILMFLEYLSELDDLKPFGAGFPSPSILLKFHPKDGEWKQMGSTKQHLKILLQYGFEVVLFNQGALFDLKDSDEECFVVGYLQMNEFRGVQSVNFIGTMELKGDDNS